MNWTRMAPAKALACVLLLAALTGAQTTPTTDVLGVHDMSSGASPMHGPNANACIYCHAPHNALSDPTLWNQTLSTNEYILYPDSTSTPSAPTKVGTASLRCLSCHDGSVGVGRTVAIGTLQMTGTFRANLGTQLQGSHPFSMQPQLKDDATLVSTLVASHTTKDSTLSRWWKTISSAPPATTFTTSTRTCAPPNSWCGTTPEVVCALRATM